VNPNALEAAREALAGRTNSFLFDFDSTLVSIETLDTLLKRAAGDEETRRKIDDITARAMNGELDFDTSLRSRLRAAGARAEHFAQMAAGITDFLTPGIEDAVSFLRSRGQDVFILSGGFREIVLPAARRLGISEENCLANDYITDADGRVSGAKENPLAHEGGKKLAVRALRERGRLRGTVVMLGDGMSDYDVYAEGLAGLFVGCGFHAVRPNVKAATAKAASAVFAETAGELLSFLYGLFGEPRPRGRRCR
jgi:phosphoserine phosphatase